MMLPLIVTFEDVDKFILEILFGSNGHTVFGNEDGKIEVK